MDLRTYWDPNKELSFGAKVINSGNLVPTKRGISLTEQQWETFLSRRNDIDKLIDLVRGSAEGSPLPKGDEVEKDLFSYVC